MAPRRARLPALWTSGVLACVLAGAPGPLVAQVRPAARRPSARPAATPARGAARRGPAALVAAYRAVVFQGNAPAAREVGALGAAALPLMRDALADGDPVVRRAGAVIAAGIGPAAAGACDALLREAALVPPFAGSAGWSADASADLAQYALADVYRAPARAGCPADAAATALAAAAARAFELRAHPEVALRSTGFEGDPEERRRAASRATAVLAAVLAGAAQLPPAAASPAGAAAHARLAPLALQAMTDTAGLRARGGASDVAAAHTAGLRYAATVGLYTPEMERQVVAQWLRPPRWAVVDGDAAGPYDDAAVAYLRQRPDRLVALAREALAGPPAALEPALGPGQLGGPCEMTPGCTAREYTRLLQRRALGLAASGGAPGVALLAELVRRDLEGARAAVQAGDPQGGAAGRRLVDAMRRLALLEGSARAAAPAVGTVLQSDLPPGSDAVAVARNTLAALRRP